MNSKTKFLKLFFISILITSSMLSCDSSDDSDSNDPNGPININLIEGEWRLDKEVDYYDGMSESYDAECSTESRMIITDNDLTAKEDYDCDGDYDEESTISISIGPYEEFDYVIMYQGFPAAIILTLTGNTLVVTDDYYVDPDTGEEEYTAYFFKKV